MSSTSRLPWERMLLAVALVVGALTMHAIVAPCDGSEHASSTAPAVASDGTARAPATDDGHSRGCDTGHLLTMCLAILITRHLVAGAAWRRWSPVSARCDRGRRTTGDMSSPERAPPRAAVRLALLCVSRR